MEMSAWALATSIPRWLRDSADSARVQGWMRQQLSLCARCVDERCGEREGGGVEEGGLRPVGGWTFDEATFLQVYASLTLTQAVLQACRTAGVTEDQSAVQKEELVKRLQRALTLRDEGEEHSSSVHPVLRGCMEGLLSALLGSTTASSAAEASAEWLGCVSGLVLKSAARAHVRM